MDRDQSGEHMQQSKSKIGYLREKLNKSGVNGNPIISDAELDQLHAALTEFRNTAEDYREYPLVYTVINQLMRLELIIEARQSTDSATRQPKITRLTPEMMTYTGKPMPLDSGPKTQTKSEYRIAIQEAMAQVLMCKVPLKSSEDIIGKANNIAIDEAFRSVKKLLE